MESAGEKVNRELEKFEVLVSKNDESVLRKAVDVEDKGVAIILHTKQIIKKDFKNVP